MAKREYVSMSVIRRLPRYYRFLTTLQSEGVERISSRELSKTINRTASQIRQDLNCFGEFGLQGYGYNVSFLLEEIRKILGLDLRQKTIFLGAGNLGKAILSHMNFREMGFDILGIFETDPALIGGRIYGNMIYSLDQLETFCKKNNPKVAVLCVPDSVALELADQLIALGIEGFWNFTHYDIALNKPGIVAENVHMSDSLMTLSYQMQDKQNQDHS